MILLPCVRQEAQRESSTFYFRLYKKSIVFRALTRECRCRELSDVKLRGCIEGLRRDGKGSARSPV